MQPIRIKEKKTNRTWVYYCGICIKTGHKVLIYPWFKGYSEYNDRNEPVLDSWIDNSNNIFKMIIKW